MIATELDTFTRAMWSVPYGPVWTTRATPLDANYGADDIAPETLQTMIAECEQFQQQNRRIIAADLSRAGFHFWLTRNHHGAGFWDGDYSPRIGRLLTDRARFS